MARRQRVLYDDEEATHMQVACHRLALASNAKAVLVFDENGQPVTQAGETEHLDVTSLGLVRLRVRQASDELTCLARGW